MLKKLSRFYFILRFEIFKTSRKEEILKEYFLDKIFILMTLWRSKLILANILYIININAQIFY